MAKQSEYVQDEVIFNWKLQSVLDGKNKKSGENMVLGVTFMIYCNSAPNLIMDDLNVP